MRRCVRFAPSPTGCLHIGNARTAIVNWLLVRQAGGEMVLRLDDTDQVRCEARFAEQIVEDLRWLGLDWDRQEHQRDGRARYEAALEQLRAAGSVYPCHETPAELQALRDRQMAAGQAPRYYESLEGRAGSTEGRRPHWRLRMTHAPGWCDALRGEQEGGAFLSSDPVLMREDGTPLYHLTSVVDDAAFGITDIIRGEDLMASTPVQVALFQNLGVPVPRFAHLPLIRGSDGGALSKRLGSLSLSDLRAQGVEAASVVAYLARLGSTIAPGAGDSLEVLKDSFALEALTTASPVFDAQGLGRLNGEVLAVLPYEMARPRIVPVSEDFWHVVRGNLARVEEAVRWWEICTGALPWQGSDQLEDFARTMLAHLPEEPWDEATFGQWTAGHRGAARPLRRLLTGQDHGPPMGQLLPHIGRARTRARLSPP